MPELSDSMVLMTIIIRIAWWIKLIVLYENKNWRNHDSQPKTTNIKLPKGVLENSQTVLSPDQCEHCKGKRGMLKRGSRQVKCFLTLDGHGHVLLFY